MKKKIALLALLARVSMLDFITADYRSFLSGWLGAFRTGGFRQLAENVGDYNLIYQYFLLMITKVPLHDLYLIKLISVAFDYALALVMMRAAEKFGTERAGLPVFCLMLIGFINDISDNLKDTKNLQSGCRSFVSGL